MKLLSLTLGVICNYFADISLGYENLALRKTAWQSSNFDQSHLASGAVDGDRTQTYTASTSCAVAAKRKDNTWRVDLGHVLSIHHIDIYYRNEGDWDYFIGRFAGFFLYVSNTTIKDDGYECLHNTEPPSDNMTINCVVHGRYVIFYNERKADFTYPPYYESYVYNELCEVEVYGCSSPGYFGNNCDTPCPVNCKNDYCDIVNGSCLSCDDGYQGLSCDTPCSNNSYGPQCSMTCAYCYNGESCNHITGKCPNGCAAGWKGDNCGLECANGWFGVNCSEKCSDNCLTGADRLCNHVSGECTHGCISGWQGQKCEKACNDYFYGMNCTEKCGPCLNNGICNHINGTCKEGCQAGWQGHECKTACDDGKFGLHCEQVCNINCDSNATRLCNHTTGECTSGCNPGWEDLQCNKECNGLSYGPKCQMQCGSCLDGQKCHHVDGTCAEGCSSGWQGPKCVDRCNETFYGLNCMLNCSSNCFNRTCDAETGECSVVAKRIEQTNSNGASLAGGIVGGLLLICVLAIVGIFLFRRSKNKKPSSYTERMDAPLAGEERSNVYSNAKSSKKEFSDIYVNVAAEKSSSAKPMKGEESNEDLDDEDQENIYANTDSKIDSFPDISIDMLEKLIKERRDNDDEDFESEYKNLPYGEIMACDAGKMDKNTKKNRFKTTFPYDHSRVVLKTDSHYTEDYINANLINGVEKERTYIASQGPKANTVEDFWRMIWQEKVSQIVMLTNLKEGPKVKCVQYWPKGNGDLAVGQFKLRKTEQKEYGYFEVRKFSLQHTETKKSRTITQYHYTTWPDHGIPDPLCLVIFHNHVMRTAVDVDAPIVVHCSAGIGRTGTYIALDALYKTGLKTRKVNIPEYVVKMRENRMNMVQTTEQYITIFLTLSEAFKAQVIPVSTSDFIAHFEKLTKDVPTNQSGLMNEFQTLLKIRPKYTDGDFKMALQNNVSRDNGCVLPHDRYVLHLTTSVPKRGSYINAITVPSFVGLKTFIITSYPTNDTAVDLLRLLIDHESCTVVSMDPFSNIGTAELWLPLESENTIGPFSIRPESMSVKDNIETRMVLLSNLKTDMKPVQLSFIAPKINMSIGKGKDTLILRELVTVVMNLGREPVTVMSSDGASLCGMFCAIYSAMQQLNLDDAVDICSIVRQLQVRRPEFCSTMDEYQTCYQAIADHISFSSDGLYYNN